MLALLAAISLLQSTEAEVPSIVGPLDRVLPQIAARFNMRLIAGTSVRADVIGIASPKRPAKVIMDGIAAAVNASWEERPEGWVLSRSRKQEQEDEEADAKYREAWIRESLASTPIDTPFDEQRAAALAEYWYEFKSKTEHTQADYAQLDTLNSRSPLGRFTRRLVEALGVPYLARLPQRTVTVFSTKPTKMQRPIPLKNFDAVLKTFLAEQNRYAQAIEKKGRPLAGQNGQFVSGFDTTSAIAGDFDKVRIRVDTSNSSQTFLTVEFCTAQGKPVASARAFFNRRVQSQPAAPGPEALLELDAETIEMLKTVERLRMPNVEREPVFKDVLKRDPLEYVHRAGLAAWSKAIDKPVMASLADGHMGTNLQPPYRLSRYRNVLAYSHVALPKEQVLVLRPLAAAEARWSRVDRRALQRAIDDRVAKGYLSIENVVELYTTRDPRTIGVHNTVISLGLPEIQSLRGELLLHLIARGAPSQRDDLLKGATLTYADLNPAQRALAERMVYGNATDFGFDVTVRIDPRDPLPREATEAFPHGVPESFTLATESIRHDGARMRGSEYTTAYTTVDLASYGLFQNDRPNLEYQPCRIRLLNATVSLTPFRGFEHNLREVQPDRKAKWGPYDTLPQSLRDEVQRQAELMKQRRVPPP